jgi:sugar phosphate isomerase/epimerase
VSVPAGLRTGLNPYGLTWHLGLQGRGTPRANPRPAGLDGFVAIAERIGAEVIEIHHGWLAEERVDRAALRARLEARSLTPVIAASLPHGPIEPAIADAAALGATTVRLGLSTTLCGDRAIHPDWPGLVSSIAAELRRLAPIAAAAGVHLAIENHQDFTSAELMAFCEGAGESVGIVMDTGNAWPVGEEPLAFARAILARIRHVHLKDYRVKATDDGFLLVRCAIGDGAAPLGEIVPLLLGCGRPLTASLEPGALEARHVRLLTPGWWRGYPPRPAEALAACLHSLRRNRIAEDEDHRTPWERGAPGAEIEAYELDMIERSAAAMRRAGLMR